MRGCFFLLYFCVIFLCCSCFVVRFFPFSLVNLILCCWVWVQLILSAAPASRKIVRHCYNASRLICNQSKNKADHVFVSLQLWILFFFGWFYRENAHFAMAYIWQFYDYSYSVLLLIFFCRSRKIWENNKIEKFH